jgi:hypothetical protein
VRLSHTIADFHYLSQKKNPPMKRILASRNITRLLIGLALLPAMAFAQNFVTTYAGTNVAGLMDGDTLTALFDQP